MKVLKLQQSVTKAKNTKLCTKSAQLAHMKENQDNLIDALSCATPIIVCIMALPIMDTKLERFLPKNQNTQRKLLNFENCTKPQ